MSAAKTIAIVDMGNMSKVIDTIDIDEYDRVIAYIPEKSTLDYENGDYGLTEFVYCENVMASIIYEIGRLDERHEVLTIHAFTKSKIIKTIISRCDLKVIE